MFFFFKAPFRPRFRSNSLLSICSSARSSSAIVDAVVDVVVVVGGGCGSSLYIFYITLNYFTLTTLLFYYNSLVLFTIPGNFLVAWVVVCWDILPYAKDTSELAAAIANQRYGVPLLICVCTGMEVASFVGEQEEEEE